MQRTELFQNLLDNLSKKSEEDYYKYIGTGNPDADILIIGKEAAIDKEKQKSQFENEIENNFNAWKEILEDPKEVPYDPQNIQYNSPLYPYRGQVFKIDDGQNRGTSRTWYNYQKLYNNIYPEKINENIDFHEGVFITEVNATPCNKTRDADAETIQFRKDNILSSDFIKDFPVIILAGVGYFDTVKNSPGDLNEIEKTFNVRFQEKRIAKGNESQPYWIHRNEENKKPQLLINTYQLSMAVSDALLAEITELVKKEIF